MTGTRKGGLKAAKTNQKLYGDGIIKENFYTAIGRLGGRSSRGGGFARIPGFASAMGKLGGANGHRGKAKKP